MPIPKVLAQSIPSVLTDVYTAPQGGAVVSTVVVCNQSGAAKFRISIAVAGAADDTKQYLYYDVDISANRTFTATIGITLAATDVIRVYSDTGTVSFNIFGVENP